LNKLNLKYIIAIIVFLMFLPLLLYGFVVSFENEFDEFYFGVDIAYADLDNFKNLVDQVSDYTNMVIIGSTGISYNQEKLNQTIQYLAEKDLSYVVFAARTTNLPSINQSSSLHADGFEGIYYDDELGGRQLDAHSHRYVLNANNYSDASSQFVDFATRRLTSAFPLPTDVEVVASDFRLFSSDYALYWFDYKAGYDVVLAQLGWNYSRQLNVALCRGAATIMERDWGAIVVWTYNDPPYLGSSEELFEDLVLAYENGAKYIVVFDSDEDFTMTTLSEEHLDAMERFWQYTKKHPRQAYLLDDRVAYVLPRDWAYGFRGPDDKIWGLWEGDELVSGISEDLGALLDEYGSKLDIIYDDNLKMDDTYEKYVFWNGTRMTP
jgi:hypothetical protein